MQTNLIVVILVVVLILFMFCKCSFGSEDFTLAQKRESDFPKQLRLGECVSAKNPSNEQERRKALRDCLKVDFQGGRGSHLTESYSVNTPGYGMPHHRKLEPIHKKLILKNKYNNPLESGRAPLKSWYINKPTWRGVVV